MLHRAGDAFIRRVRPSIPRPSAWPLQTGARLVIANMLWLPPHPTTLTLAREVAVLPHEEDLDAVRETAARAAARGVKTELLRISSRRPLHPRRSPRWCARWPPGGSGAGPGGWCGSPRAADRLAAKPTDAA